MLRMLPKLFFSFSNFSFFFFFGNPKLQHMTLVSWMDAFEQFYACKEPYC